MVQLTEVVDEEFLKTQPSHDEEDDDFTDTGRCKALSPNGSSPKSSQDFYKDCILKQFRRNKGKKSKLITRPILTFSPPPDSEISTDSDYDVSGETLSDRIYALRDIVPPTTRGWIHGKWMGATNIFRTTAAFLGRSAWHISVSAMLFGIPFALLWSEEQGMIAMEQEQRMREQGGELLTAGAAGGAPGGGDINSLDQLESALGGGVGSVSAKPSL